MPAAVNQTDRIQNAIHDRISSYDFRLVIYQDGLRTTVPDTVPPKTILVHETSATFGDAKLNRRTLRHERETWIWTATIAFDREVSLVEFEESLLNDPIRLPRDNDFNQSVTVSLSEVDFTHPAEQQPASGLRAVYRFSASLSPV